MISKGSAINKFAELALRFRSDLFDPRLQNHRNSSNYFEDFAIEERAKPVLDSDRGVA